MAGLPWFEMDVDFHGDPKIRALASRLREPLADSYVARLYAYCYKHVADRFDAAVASDSIEDACVWRGRKGTLYDALLAVEVLERTPGKVIVHGVAARLAPHVAKRESDRIRIAERRDKAAKSIGRRTDVAETSLRRRGDVQGDRDRDRDKDSSGSEGEGESRGEAPPPKRGGLPLRHELHDASHPLSAQLLAWLAARGVHVNHASKPATRSAVEANCARDGVEVVGERVRAAYELDPKPALGWYLDAMTAPRRPPSSGREWWHDAPPALIARFQAERLTLDPTLDGAPIPATGVRCVPAVEALIARYAGEARQ
jgi:hypothetical protein